MVKNTNNSEIKYFSNIELGEKFDNPHLHIQLWYDNQEQINRIFDKVIAEYGLFSEYCKVNISDVEGKVFNYVIKDYDNNKSEEYLFLLDDVKRDYRSKLASNIRFSSHSKGRYSKEVYKRAYGRGIAKADVDYLIDNCIVDKDILFIYNRVIWLKAVLFSFLVPLITREMILFDYLNICNEYIQIIRLWRIYSYF